MKTQLRKLIGKLYVSLMEEPKKEGMAKLLDKIENINEALIQEHLDAHIQYIDTGKDVYPDATPNTYYEDDIYWSCRRIAEKKLDKKYWSISHLIDEGFIQFKCH